MRYKLPGIVPGIALLFALHFQVQAQTEKLWETEPLLTTCESVLYIAGEEMILASCINGKATEKDGNGFIARLSKDGKIIKKQWADGLNAPKGMGILEGELYVTDIDRVVRIDMKTGKLLDEYPVEGASFLNDVTVDPASGAVYISDMSTGKIHRLANGQVEEFGVTTNLSRPNGLCFTGGQLYIGTKDGIFRSDPETGESELLIENTGSIDGLESLGEERFIISDWSGKVQIVAAEEAPMVLFDKSTEGINAADIDYYSDDNLLLVPTFFRNSVAAYRVE